MRMLAKLFALMSLLVVSPLWADSDNASAWLNKVSFRLSAEQWVTTKTGLVTMGISAGVSNAELERIQDEVLKKLNQLADKVEWHIVSFDRNLDQSGLENVHMVAQARVPFAALVNLRDKAKGMSKPGETYTLDNIQFIPSEDELRDANIALRASIYQQAKNELDRVNKAYADQKYSIHDVDFLDNLPLPMPTPQNTMMMAMRVGGNTAASNLAVGNKVVLTATVVLATMPAKPV